MADGRPFSSWVPMRRTSSHGRTSSIRTIGASAGLPRRESLATAMAQSAPRRTLTVMDNVIEVSGLRKTYGSLVAVQDVSFSVRRGEIFGVLGPNGAGKTTTVESIAGLRRPNAGAIRVLGLDPERDGRQLRQRLGVQLQQATLPDRLKVWEALELFASFYQAPADWRRLVEEWDLTEKENASFASLSGGQRQRLFIALALVGDPEVVILDELTSGLDPQARRATWELVRAVRDAGTTVVLVTHFMDEAERLCDRLAIIDEGRIVASGSPRDLIDGIGVEPHVRFTAHGSDLGARRYFHTSRRSVSSERGATQTPTCRHLRTAWPVRVGCIDALGAALVVAAGLLGRDGVKRPR